MIDVMVIGNWGSVGLAGEFDVSNAEEVCRIAGELIDQDVTELTVDLSRVDLSSAAGLMALVATDELLQSVYGRMLLLGATSATQRLLALTGLDRVLPVFVTPACPDPPYGAAPPLGPGDNRASIVVPLPEPFMFGQR